MSNIHFHLKQLCDACNAHNLDRVMNHFTDDWVLEMPRGNQPWGSRFDGARRCRGSTTLAPDPGIGGPYL
jgi:ketosteroid isomerase-like protein